MPSVGLRESNEGIRVLLRPVSLVYTFLDYWMFREINFRSNPVYVYLRCPTRFYLRIWSLYQGDSQTMYTDHKLGCRPSVRMWVPGRGSFVERGNVGNSYVCEHRAVHNSTDLLMVQIDVNDNAVACDSLDQLTEYHQSINTKWCQ